MSEDLFKLFAKQTTTEDEEKKPGRRRRRRRRRMDKFELDEISFVNRPAQEPALASVIKADGTKGVALKADETTEKNGDLVSLLSSSSEGHQHGISLNNFGEEASEMFVTVSFAITEGEERPHDHQIVRAADGSYTMSENDGHTHEVDQEAFRQAFFDAMIKAAPENEEAITNLLQTKASEQTAGSSGAVEVGKVENTMSNEKTAADALSAENETLKADLAKAAAVSTMNDAQKAHMEGLEGDAKDAFISKSFDDRSAELDNLSKADPVIYKSGDGTEYHKSDDKRLVKMAKDRDSDRKELEEITKKREDDRLEKAAEEDFGNLPGTVEVRAAIVKSIEGIEDETIREEAMKVLKANNAKMAGAFQTVGKDGVGKSADMSDREEAVSELNDKAAELVKAGTCKTNADAFVKASEMNPDLYSRSRAV